MVGGVCCVALGDLVIHLRLYNQILRIGISEFSRRRVRR